MDVVIAHRLYNGVGGCGCLLLRIKSTRRIVLLIVLSVGIFICFAQHERKGARRQKQECRGNPGESR